jgi:hypothetical protein
MTSSKQQPQVPVKLRTFRRDLRPVDQEDPRILALRRLRAMAYRAAVARNTTVDICDTLQSADPTRLPDVLSRLHKEAQARLDEAKTTLASIEHELEAEGLPTLKDQADPLALDEGEACPDPENEAQVIRDLATLNGLAQAQTLLRTRLTDIF